MSAETQTQDQKPGRQDSPQDEREREEQEGSSRSSSGSTTVTGSGRIGADGQSYYVAPSSYLKPLGRPQGAGAKAGAPGHGENGKGAGMEKKQMSSLDRDQVEGLVSLLPLRSMRAENIVCVGCYRLRLANVLSWIARYASIPEGQDMLRCAPVKLPFNRIRYWAPCEEKLEHPYPVRYVSSTSSNLSYHRLRHLGTGIVSAPLWDSKSSTFAGLLTVSDYINVIQYYWQNPNAMSEIEKFKLNSLREIERAIGVTPIETVSIHPLRPLYEACTRLIQSRARRIPLVDVDDETQREMVVSLVTQYRILKFVSINVKETQMLRKPLRDLPGVGTYENLAVANMDTPVMDVIHLLVKRNISCVPIVDRDGTVLNVFEAVDVITLINGGDYEKLNYSAGKALELRSAV